MRAILLIALASLGLSAQTAVELFKKAPPSVDEALRARVSEFYQFHVDKKFRKAEALVVEESKDAFYAAPKQEPLSFAINEIQYEENFTKAKVMSLLAVERAVPFATGYVKMNLPVQSFWKVVDGQWFLYLPAQPCRPTPMGPCRAFTPEEIKAARDQTDLKKRIDEEFQKAQRGLGGNWQIDPRTLIIEAKPNATGSVTVKNPINGHLTLDVSRFREAAILEVTVQGSPVGPDQEGKILIKVKDAAAFKGPIQIPLVIQPFNRVELITVSPKP
ncbi:MAG: hypothetical protein K2Q23_07535 [Bryobacteraceae bacterium]|nr:hypothetical protein [Bryobacteraceae bacterium]